MDERAMTNLFGAPYGLVLAVCIIGGLGLGLAYFRSLRTSADLLVRGGHPLLGLALAFGRLACLGAGLYLAALAGGLALLAALAGILWAKAVILRSTRDDPA